MTNSRGLALKRLADFKRERALMRSGLTNIVGIDEAGIGPWAGPVVAAAVRLNPNALPKGVADSKTLTASRRVRAFEEILQLADVGIGIADVGRIDRDNVLRASHWAMAEAVRALALRPDLALVDGKHVPQLDCPAEAIIDGDALVLSIAAASIVAKVTRDRLLVELAARHPGYGFEKHKGYGTAEHRAAIARLGLTPAHRRSFRPIQEAEAAITAVATANPAAPLTHGSDTSG
jgi:ribonuclease HII